jgi:peptidyl-prolyl cis-trans isomerase D
MLKTMRDSFHQLKWTLFAVIIVFILGFVFFSGSNAGGSRNRGEELARVGDESVTAADFDRIYQAEVRRLQAQYQGNLSPELIRAMDLPHQVLERLIERILKLEAARRLNLKVGDDELRQTIASIPGLQENGTFIGQQRYEQLLRANGTMPDRFEEDLREQLLLEKYAGLVKASVLVSDADIQREFAARSEKASIEYIKIPAARLDGGAEPTDADLKTYYDRHRERYRAPEQRRVKYLLVDSARIRAKTTVPDADLRAEYERKKSGFGVPEQVSASHILVKIDPSKGPAADDAARQKAEKLLARARSEQDFAKLAKEVSEDPAAKENGGIWPPFGRGQGLPPELEQALFEMRPGEVRGPIKTASGYEIVKLAAKMPPRVRTFEEVRPQLSAELSERRAEAETQRRARDLAETLKRLKNSSDEELRKLQDGDAVTYNTTDWISRGEAIPGIGSNPRFSELAWSLKIGQLGKDPVSTPRGPAFVKPSEERPAGVPPLAEIRARVAQDWKAEHRDEEALEKLAPAVRELTSGATLASLAARYETEVKTTTEFGPGGPVPDIGSAPELSSAVFQTPEGQVGRAVPVPGGFVLYRVLKRTAADPTALEIQRAELADSVRAREADRLVRSYLQQLRADRKVRVNEELLQSFVPETTGRRG